MSTRRKIAVLLGGPSAERDISLVSGKACAAALTRLGHEVIEVDPREKAQAWDLLAASDPDIVFNALHGPWGEDGVVQGLLETFGRPYTHSGVLASAVAMDKERAKAVFRAAGLDCPAGRIVSRAEAAAGHVMPAPYVAKPNNQGSSFGVHIVRVGDNRPPAALAAEGADLGAEVLVEEYIAGRELTVAVLGEDPLGVTEIIPRTEFYDYEAKYAAGGSAHEIPARVPKAVEINCLQSALTAHNALGCKGLTRSDFRWDTDKDRLALLEINTQPGMTPTSLAPEQAAARGMDFDALCAWMAEDASCPR
jgi:D-alanine-D-alanine ligase